VRHRFAPTTRVAPTPAVHALAAFVSGVLATVAASPALAHHGVAAVGFGDPEGPGAAMETTMAIPLPRYAALALIKSEFVSFQARGDRTVFPAQKDFAVYNMALLGFGIAPYLTAYVFQPFNVKSMDGGVGQNKGLGDTSLMLAFGWKWDDGLRLIPQKESLDELLDWHFLLWAACSLPTGPTERVGGNGEPLAPDMQTGFGAPSFSLGLSALKQVSTDWTLLAEVNQQRFLTHDYSFVRYRFGAETRLNLAGVYRAYARGRARVDVFGELAGLHLQRDREDADLGGPLPMTALEGSGGDILYGGLGMRAMLGRVSLALGIKRSVLRRLNEGEAQQGSEGLENFRLSLALGGALPL
jgi:hypothetical protein